MAGQTYRIRIKSHLDTHWQSWFEDMTIRHAANGETVLTGSIPDQAALFGALMKLRDLGLALVSVEPVVDNTDLDFLNKEDEG